jgi:hypothetical protein
LGNYLLIRGERLPPVCRLAHVEGARVLYVYPCHHRLLVREHGAKVSPDRSRQALQLVEVDDLWPNRYAGCS